MPAQMHVHAAICCGRCVLARLRARASGVLFILLFLTCCVFAVKWLAAERNVMGAEEHDGRSTSTTALCISYNATVTSSDVISDVPCMVVLRCAARQVNFSASFAMRWTNSSGPAMFWRIRQFSSTLAAETPLEAAPSSASVISDAMSHVLPDDGLPAPVSLANATDADSTFVFLPWNTTRSSQWSRFGASWNVNGGFVALLIAALALCLCCICVFTRTVASPSPPASPATFVMS